MAAEQWVLQCRTCGKTVVHSTEHPAPFFPFCSQRCKLRDLGRWIDGEHRIEDGLPPGGQDAQGADEKP